MSDKKNQLWINTYLEFKWNPKSKQYEDAYIEGFLYSGALSLLHPTYTSDQSGYRWRNDDGSETAATWIELLDTTTDIDVSSSNIQKRLRLAISETGGAEGSEGAGFQLEFSINGGAYTNLTTTSTGVKAYDSSNLVEEEGGDCTQQISAPDTFVSTNEGIIEDGSGDFEVAFGGTDTSEAEYTIEFITADLSDNDSINFRVAALDGWTSVANATITISASGVTGTGTLNSQNATTSGTAEITKTGSGVLNSQNATTAGTGTVGSIVDGSGTLNSQNATMTGTAEIVKTGSGVLNSQNATIVGSADITKTGSGVLNSQNATVAGIGDVGSVVTGTGTLDSQNATISGAGNIEKTGSGVLDSQGATMSGAGLIEKTGSGVLDSQNSTMAGTGTVGAVTTGSGVLDSQNSTIAGSGLIEKTGSGTLNSQNATVNGTAEIVKTGSGNLQSQNATVAGSGTVGNIITGTGSLDSQNATVSGSAEIIKAGSGVLDSQNATMTGAATITKTGSGVLNSQSATMYGFDVEPETEEPTGGWLPSKVYTTARTALDYVKSKISKVIKPEKEIEEIIEPIVEPEIEPVKTPATVDIILKAGDVVDEKALIKAIEAELEAKGVDPDDYDLAISLILIAIASADE